MAAAEDKFDPTPEEPKERRPVEFAFDARNKSIARSVFALEARWLKSFFKRKPKVSLHEMEEALKEGSSEGELNKLIPKFIASYGPNTEHGYQFLETLGRLLLEAASKEKESGDRQWYLLNQSMDVFRLGLQKSPKVINISTQSMIVAVSKILGSEAGYDFYVEKEIHKEMMTMLNLKKDPNDFASREKIIKLYLMGKQHYEALVHTAEYEKIMQIKSRSLYRQKAGEIAFRKAGIFQMMVEHYQKIALGKAGEEVDKEAELQRLDNFVIRFNRDNRRINIIPLKALNLLSLNKTMVSMLAIASNFYTEAATSEHFQARHKAQFLMARNNYAFESPKKAIGNLAEGIRLVDLSRMPDKQKAQEKIKLMEFQQKIYGETGQQRKADELGQELTRLRRNARAEAKAETPRAEPLEEMPESA